MKKIKKIVSEFNLLCKSNQFKNAGKLARKHKNDFIEMIKNGGNDEMLYAYKVCSIFNMRQTDCFNLKY
jgi:hypothetical protein